jgi:hypothetical protein
VGCVSSTSVSLDISIALRKNHVSGLTQSSPGVQAFSFTFG